MAITTKAESKTETRAQSSSLNAASSSKGFFRTAEIVGAAFGVVAVVALLLAPTFVSPSEDATILFRYAENFSRTFSISYNPGGPPTEGATDFLYMLTLGLLNIVHIPPFVSACALNAAALVLMAVLLQKIRGSKPTLLATFAIAFLLALSPQMSAALGGFSVFLVGAAICLTAYYYTRGDDRRMALSALAFCLLRPDGLAIAGPLIALRLAQARNRVNAIGTYVLAFALPGLIYFLWRAHYFHEWLPLPYLVKADTHRLLGLIVPASEYGERIYLLAMSVILWVSCGRQLGERRNLFLLAALLIVPTLVYWHFRLDQNIGDRFFFFVIAGTAVILAANWEDLLLSRESLIVTILLVFAASPLHARWSSDIRWLMSGGHANARVIADDIRRSGLTGKMAVTEAGQIPYYSGWPAIDLWGLNTPRFARRAPQPADLESLAADLVAIYPGHLDPRICAEGVQASANSGVGRNWGGMVSNAIAGLQPDQYTLIFVPYDSERLRRMDGLLPSQGPYICFFTRKQYSGASELNELLKRGGGIDSADFLKLRDSDRSPTS